MHQCLSEKGHQSPHWPHGRYNADIPISHLYVILRQHDIWWAIELPYWFKACFLLRILGIFSVQYVKDNFMLNKFQPTLE